MFTSVCSFENTMKLLSINNNVYEYSYVSSVYNQYVKLNDLEIINPINCNDIVLPLNYDDTVLFEFKNIKSTILSYELLNLINFLDSYC